MSQHPLVRQETPGNSFGVIQTIDAYQKLQIVPPAKLLCFTSHLWFPRQGRETFRIDSHGEHSEADLPIGELYPIDIDGEPQKLGERSRKMPEIRRGVKADQVGPYQPPKQALALRQCPEQLFGGKRDVEEETDACLGEPLTKEFRHQKQLIVVHPDQVTCLVVPSHAISEDLIDFEVRLPVPDMERNLVHQVVEQRPEDTVGEALVVAGDLLVGKGDPNQTKAGELLVELRLLLLGHLPRRP